MKSFAKIALTTASLLVIAQAGATAQENPDQLLWGDTHLHSNLSVDAYFMGNRTATADEAYRFAKGEPVIHPYSRARMQLETPLDFLAVTDHAEMLGVPYSLLTLNDQKLVDTRLGSRLIQLNEAGRERDAFGLFLTAVVTGGLKDDERPPKIGLLTLLRWKFMDLIQPADNRARAIRWLASDTSIVRELDNEEILKSHWQTNLDAAERHNNPGVFTTLIGWEYTPNTDGANLHRIVLTPNDANVSAQYFPFSSNDSTNPEDLWNWLDTKSSEHGADFVSIPHNSNISKGKMFARVNSAGEPIDEGYASQRSKWETVAEVTQIKGTSETHPLLSPDDEFAGFEFFNRLIETRAEAQKVPTITEADYVRTALKTGLELGEDIGVNPYKLGMIGSTDSHTGLATAEEDNFGGKFGVDSIPEGREFIRDDVSGWQMSSAGLAGVWARENTREEIIAAFKRREVYGSTGPRIKVRFFGGYGFDGNDLDARNLARIGYRKGVPMGGDITSSRRGTPPSFLIHAVKDAKGANLDRIQIVKGWIGEDGKAKEKVFDIVWSGGKRDPDENGKLPPVGDTVDRRTGAVDNSIGAPELAAVWRDPEFEVEARAFYYVRVLQIPTARNSLYDSLALGEAPPAGFPEVIQERAYTSPIWYTPDVQ